MSQLSAVQQNTLKRAIQLLIACKAKFHIETPDGERHGEALEVARPTSGRGSRPLQGPKNAEYLRLAFEGMQPGDVRKVVPQAGDSIERLCRNTSASLSKWWGNGSYTYARMADGIEVLRVY